MPKTRYACQILVTIFDRARCAFTCQRQLRKLERTLFCQAKKMHVNCTNQAWLSKLSIVAQRGRSCSSLSCLLRSDFIGKTLDGCKPSRILCV